MVCSRFHADNVITNSPNRIVMAPHKSTRSAQIDRFESPRFMLTLHEGGVPNAENPIKVSFGSDNGDSHRFDTFVEKENSWRV